MVAKLRWPSAKPHFMLQRRGINDENTAKGLDKGRLRHPVMCSCTEIYTSYRMCYNILAFCPTHSQIAAVKTEVPSK